MIVEQDEVQSYIIRPLYTKRFKKVGSTRQMKGISEGSDAAKYDSFPAGWKKLPLAHAEEEDVTKPIGEKIDEGVCLKKQPSVKVRRQRKYGWCV